MKQYFLFRLFPYFLLKGNLMVAYSCKKDNEGKS